MAGVWHDQGENNILDAYFKGQNRPAGWYLGLYSNVSALGEAASLADVTEISGTGYARQPLIDDDWTLLNDQVTGVQQTFEPASGSWNVTGWFLTDKADTTGKLIASEHFADGPYVVPVGGNIKLTPKITAS